MSTKIKVMNYLVKVSYKPRCGRYLFPASFPNLNLSMFFSRNLIYLLIVSCFGCQYEQLSPVSDCSSSNLALSVVGDIQGANCGVSNGGFQVEATGGDGVYEYAIDDSFQTSGQFSNLSAGTYEVMVSDGNNCTSTVLVSIQNVDGINISLDVDDTGCGSTNGSIIVNATGGETPYTYSLNDASAVSSNTFNNLAAGEYTITATDNVGCVITQTVTLTTGVSYNATIDNIISSNCATSNCHGGNVSPNLSSLSNIQQNAGRIKAQTGSGSMPPSGKLSQTQIDAIACWVDDGAQNN
ncbi:SprB repeat-containing protein [Chondrinema litorale]|uniref:SprB repeat-containing protein n=1 Tax=Chondrinema litorale TaxID=2994555 RepID=UPI002542B780|nr:SprB repeat-containing protein [Chondrinema litorale]UZR96557.1 SprB repeat-containing protein [Chondrinema litorale]